LKKQGQYINKSEWVDLWQKHYKLIIDQFVQLRIAGAELGTASLGFNLLACRSIFGVCWVFNLVLNHQIF
ncbi:hypothetical protein, partial [Staphylococcus pseudintermedius]|uniref:hypothetical protein n=1 Tax=Staphylococcus pseudintermedius TaxID=283734 RepID=UPI00197F72F8